MFRTTGPGLALLVLVTPAWAELAIRDVTPTYGPLGPARKSLAVPAGDELYFRYAITGVRTDAAGRVDGELHVQLTGPNGQALLDDKRPINGLLALGGQTLPATANVSFGPETPAGDYTMTVTVRDKLSGESASFQRKVTCTKAAFALVRLRLSHDERGTIPAAGGMLGQTVHVRCQAIGFDRSQAKVRVVIAMETADAEERSLMPRPIQARLATEGAEQVAQVRSVDFNGSLILNRVGKFTLRLTATDEVSGQKAEVRVPLHVAAAPCRGG
jgi:hypothetical protein